MTWPWIVASAAAGLIAGPRLRGSIFFRSVQPGEPPRRRCPACGRETGPARHRWRALLPVTGLPVTGLPVTGLPVTGLPVTGRCPGCRARIGPAALSVELAAGLALAVVAARVSSPWELAGLAWLALFAVPLVFIDIAVRRLPDALTGGAFAGTVGFLAVAALTGGHLGQLGRAGLAAVALCGFYLLLFLIRPSGMGLGDVKLAASVGAALGWPGWGQVVAGTFLAFAAAALYAVGLLLFRRATAATAFPLGPFMVLGALAVILA